MSQNNYTKNVPNEKQSTLKFPYKIETVDSEINKQLLNYFKGERTGFVQVGPEKYFFPNKYVHHAQNYWNFKLRNDDVWIVTFPRSGTTLTQEMVWLIANDLDYQKAANIPLHVRFPFLEHNLIFHDELIKEILIENSENEENSEIAQSVFNSSLVTLEQTSERRFIKTHFPFSLLPEKLPGDSRKVIYIARNPKDVAISYYHLYRQWRNMGYISNFQKFWHYFENNYVVWAPYWSHVHEAWKIRYEENMLFMFYEDMNKYPAKTISQVAKFLGKDLTTTEVAKLEDHLKIENFKNNKSINLDVLKKIGILKKNEEDFIRNGKCGNWKEYFDDELNTRADKWIKENLQNSDLFFPK